MALEGVEWSLPAERPAAQGVSYRPRRLGPRLSPAERRLLLASVDLLLLYAALLAALLFWGDFPASPAALVANYKWFVTLAAVWLLFGAALDVYNLERAASTTQSTLYAGLAALLAALVYLAIPWLTPPYARRLEALSFLALAVVGVPGWRALYAQLFFQPAFRRRVLVVGGGAATHALIGELQAAAMHERANPFRGSGYVVVGLLEGEPLGDLPVLSPTQSLIHQARCLGVDEILVSDADGLSPALREAVLDCWELGLPVTPLSVAYERLTARLALEYAGHDLGVVARAADSPAVRLYQAGKRTMDILAALLGLALVGLLAPGIALANALGSPGPLFYRQQRVGQGGRPFVLVKFRTMVLQAEGAVGAVWASDDDRRVTPIGRWLRRAGLDELPQVINMLRGEMSLVGPRPERPQFVGELVRAMPLYRARHALRPGITGWAQVRYRYASSVEEAKTKLEYDLYYVKHASFFLDLLIMLQTLPVMLRLKGC